MAAIAARMGKLYFFFEEIWYSLDGVANETRKQIGFRWYLKQRAGYSPRPGVVED
jgi:hypothetical protein